MFQSNFPASCALSPIANNENSDYFGITTGYIKNPWQVSSNTARGCTTTNTEDIAAAHTRACREPETASRYHRDSSRFFCESTEVSPERHQSPGNGALFAESCFCGKLSVLKAHAPRLRQKSLSHNGIEPATPTPLYRGLFLRTFVQMISRNLGTGQNLLSVDNKEFPNCTLFLTGTGDFSETQNKIGQKCLLTAIFQILRETKAHSFNQPKSLWDKGFCEKQKRCNLSGRIWEVTKNWRGEWESNLGYKALLASCQLASILRLSPRLTAMHCHQAVSVGINYEWLSACVSF